jgi:tetratricopeptide (TPR) repeat protein
MFMTSNKEEGMRSLVMTMAMGLASLEMLMTGCSVYKDMTAPSQDRVATLDVPFDGDNVTVTATASSSSGDSFEGVGHLRNRDWDKAVECLTRVIEKDPEDTQAHFALGVAYEMLDQYPNAEKHYKKANLYEGGSEQHQQAVLRILRKQGK